MKKLYIVLLSYLLSGSLIAQNFQEITGTPFEGVSQGSISFADVDNDGDQDVLITGNKGAATLPYIGHLSKLYINNGNGNFTEVSDTPFEEVRFSSIAFADVDNDNDQDVLITGSPGRQWEISILYTNYGNGNYAYVTGTPFVDVYQSSIAFADIDNDNDQDILITGGSGIGGFSNVYARLYTNDGNGNFTEILDIPLDGVDHSSIAFADIDNDNDQDVLITGISYSGEISKLYTNDGNGNFTEVSDTPFEGVGYSSIAFADVDNDNDQDVLITGRNNSDEKIAKLYTNDGNGIFTEDIGSSFVGVSGSSIAFADIDNDNDQDVLITGSGIAKLYTNDGNGVFTEVLDTPFDGIFYSSIAFADIDSDGDQDVLITGGNGDELISKLYRNLTIVGIDEIDLFNMVSIYPNPNNGLINIDLGSLNNVSLKVLNVSGQLIYFKENINSPIYQFELDASPGIYILELSAEGEKQQFKLVKN